MSGETLLRLLNDILDLSKIEARKLGLELIDFDLHHTFQQAVEMVAIKAHEKGLEVVCRIEPDVPALLRGDPGRLCQVLVNLAGNAVKFTPKGQVLVRARLEFEDERRVRIRVEVEDTGIGIPADRLSTLFRPFTQVDGSITRQFGGTGLGLAISRELVEMMGGTIGVRSELGKGSCFDFSIVMEKQLEGAASTPSPWAGFQGLRVLIVDDNEADTALLKDSLEGWGCRCDSAKNAGSALELLGAAASALDHFRVVLLDHLLPGTDVAELALQIRNVPAPQELRLILLKPLGYDGCSKPPSGCCSCIYKPIRTQQLHDCLRTAIDPNVRGGKSCSEGKPLPRRPLTASRSLSILVVEDHPMNQAVILETIKTLGHRADPVGNGYEAIQSLRDIPYHLVLMDCQMPEMDGFEASRRIRAGEAGMQNSMVPIIALTAHARAEDRQKCLLAGMNDYLSKPVRIEEVASILERWGAVSGVMLRKAAAPAETARMIMALPAPLPASRQLRRRFAREKLLVNFMGNQELARKAIGLFLDDLPKQMSLLKLSLQCCNHVACEKVAHRFKGAFAQLGAQLAAELASQMEQMAKAEQITSISSLLLLLEAEIASLAEIAKEI
jgi:CheY-like chemotaxis protein